MKTITGKITSSTPVSISKAASIISKFVSAKTGASQAICAYLRRANAAFDELAHVHSKSDRRKQNRHKSKKTQSEEVTAEKLSRSEFSPEVKTEMKRENKKKNEEKGHFGNPVDNSEGKVLCDGEGIHRKKHKKKQEGEREICLVAGYKENGREVVGKKGENEDTIIINEGKKKRKNEEVAKKKDDGTEKKDAGKSFSLAYVLDLFSRSTPEKDKCELQLVFRFISIASRSRYKDNRFRVSMLNTEKPSFVQFSSIMISNLLSLIFGKKMNLNLVSTAMKIMNNLQCVKSPNSGHCSHFGCLL